MPSFRAGEAPPVPCAAYIIYSSSAIGYKRGGGQVGLPRHQISLCPWRLLAYQSLLDELETIMIVLGAGLECRLTVTFFCGC